MLNLKSPWISVITVTYNNAAGLAATARSLRNQRSRSYEWIIVDGGSQDQTPAVVDEFLDLNPSFVSEPDSGIYDAMNKGLARAKGEFVIFMNAGDSFASDSVVEDIERIVSAPEAIPVDLIFGNSTMLLPNGRKLPRPLKRVTRYIWHGLPTFHQSIIFRRTAHIKYPYPLEFRVSSDYAVVARMIAARHAFLEVDTVISVNEIGGDSFSHSAGATQNDDVRRIQRELGVPWYLRVISRLRRAAARQLVDLSSLIQPSSTR